VSYQVNREILALDRAAGFLRDDAAGVAALWESISQLADQPCLPASTRSPPAVQRSSWHTCLGRGDHILPANSASASPGRQLTIEATVNL